MKETINKKKQSEQQKEHFIPKENKASSLLNSDLDKGSKELIIEHYRDNVVVLSEYGSIDFSPSTLKDIVGGEKLSYNDYLYIQFCSAGKQRTWFKTCYYNIPIEFRGKIERFTKKAVCFKAIYVSGMYPDGTMFNGKEEHVWIDSIYFKDYEVGDSLSFFADVYCYLKTSNGKILDYSLRNPKNIKKIDSYSLPSDKELKEQSINEIICETCYLGEHCFGMCLRNQKEIETLRKQMYSMLQDED